MGIFQIADLIVKIDPQSEPLLENSVAYGLDTDAAVDVDIVLTDDMRTRLVAQHPEVPSNVMEYLYTGAWFYHKLLSFQGFMLHASAVVYEGQAYLFSAPSGTGKSTHTGLWQKYFGTEHAFILNDDKPALRLTANGWMAYGTPFSGKANLSRNVGVPLKGICFLERGSENVISPMSEKNAIQNLMFQTVRPRDAADMDLLLQLIEKIIDSIPVFQMQCTMSPDAARVAYEAMSKDR